MAVGRCEKDAQRGLLIRSLGKEDASNKVTSSSKKSAQVLDVVSLGFGIHLAWFYLVLFISFDSFAALYPSNFPYDSIGGISVAPSILITTCGAVLILLSYMDRLSWGAERFIVPAAALLMCLGTLLLLFGKNTSDSFLVAISCGMIGVGHATMLVVWGNEYSRRGSVSIIVNTTCATLCTCVLFVLFWKLLPPQIAAGLMPLMPLIALAAHAPFRGNRLSENRPLSRRFDAFKGSLLVKLGIPAFAFGFLSCILAITVLSATASYGTVAFGLSLVVGFALATSIPVLFFKREKGRSWGFLLRPMMPLIAVLFSVAFLCKQSEVLLSTGALIATFFCLHALVWMFFAELSQRFKLTARLVFGFGYGMFMFGALPFLIPISPSLMAYIFEGEYLIVVVFLILILVYAVLPREYEIKETLGIQDSATHAAGKSGHSDTAGTGQSAQQGGFEKDCEALAHRFALSKRETEVMTLLAKGHTIASIQKRLYISQGTVKTHISRIYKKLDVHSQQELIDLCEEAGARS